MIKSIAIISFAFAIHGCSNSVTKNDSDQNIKISEEQRNHNNFKSENQSYIIAKQYEGNDDKLYIEYLLKASEEGDPVAQNELANNYTFGYKVEKSSKLFIFWAKKSALQGYTLAQLNLGTAYYMGVNGVDEDREEAKKWLKMAAENGDETAKKYLEELR